MVHIRTQFRAPTTTSSANFWSANVRIGSKVPFLNETSYIENYITSKQDYDGSLKPFANNLQFYKDTGATAKEKEELNRDVALILGKEMIESVDGENGFAFAEAGTSVVLRSYARLCYADAVLVSAVKVSYLSTAASTTPDVVDVKNMYVHPFGPWTNDLVCPGWDTNTWRFFYKDNISMSPSIDQASKAMFNSNFNAYCRPCTLVDDFWVMIEPSKFSGVVMWVPNPVELIKYEYAHGTFAFWSVLLILISSIMLIFKPLRKHLPSAITDKIFTADNNRGRPKKN